jgi:hypothetical protein
MPSEFFCSGFWVKSSSSIEHFASPSGCKRKKKKRKKERISKKTQKIPKLLLRLVALFAHYRRNQKITAERGSTSREANYELQARITSISKQNVVLRSPLQETGN